MPTDLDDAWDDLHDATPASWFVGRPSYDEGRKVWEQYAFGDASDLGGSTSRVSSTIPLGHRPEPPRR
jgi:hypothetical protein